MTQRTYWHLADSRRVPSEYEIVSTRLLYHRPRGFEVGAPAGEWMRRVQSAIPLRVPDWDAFHDPDETTYTSYVERQRDAEAFLGVLLDSPGRTAADRALQPEWLEFLEEAFAPLRYPCHGLQLISAYLAHAAPSGRIVLALAFQTADDLRRVDRLAYRLQQLRKHAPALGATSRERWQEDARFQPLRRAIEQLMCTYEWCEAFAASQLVLRPLFDHLTSVAWSAHARAAGDDAYAGLGLSFETDAARHRRSTSELVRLVLASDPGNAAILERAVDAWLPRALAAINALAELADANGDDAAAAILALHEHLAACGLRARDEIPQGGAGR